MPSIEGELNNPSTEEMFDVEMESGKSMYDTIMETARGQLQMSLSRGRESGWWDPRSKAWSEDGQRAFRDRYSHYEGYEKVMARVAKALSEEEFDQ